MCTVVIEKFTEDGVIFISTNFTSSRTASRGFEKLRDKRYFCSYQKLFTLNHSEPYQKEHEVKWDEIPRLVTQYTSGAFGLDALNEVLSNPPSQSTKLACLRQHFTEQYQVLKHAEIGSYFKVWFCQQIWCEDFRPYVDGVCDCEFGCPCITVKIRKTPRDNRDDYLVKIYGVFPARSVRSECYRWAKLIFFKTGDVAKILPEGITREVGKRDIFNVSKAFFFSHPSEIITERPVVRERDPFEDDYDDEFPYYVNPDSQCQNRSSEEEEDTDGESGHGEIV